MADAIDTTIMQNKKWRTYMPREFIAKTTSGSAASSYEVYHSSEFRALCKRFGIPWECLTLSLTINLPLDGLMSVIHEYRGFNKGEQEKQEECLPPILREATKHAGS